MDDKKEYAASVEQMIADLKENPSSRFSKSDFQGLVYAVLADENFKAKKWILKHDQLIADDVDINSSMKAFLDKLLKHAGMVSSSERANIIDTFEYGPNDIEWVSDAIDEAMYIYTECGKNMRVFRNKLLMVGLRKMERSGKYAGKITYKKSLVDRMLALQRRMDKK